MTPLLEVENLVKHFPITGTNAVVQAVNGVSFTIGRGETVSLVGESGSGKTTVGRCVLGLTPLTGGNIRFKGRATGSKWNVRSPDLRGKMQLVFQEPGESLNPRITVFESIVEPLRPARLKQAERDSRVKAVIGRVRLPQSVLGQYPAELSAGDQQRVAIARSLITQPELIVLDEPTSALSPTARAEILDLLLRLQKELGTAYLFISHDLSAVHQLSHRIAVLYLGRIIEEGAAREVFRTPHHPYSIGLLSSVMLPIPNMKRDAFVLEGEIPSPINLPKGCPLVSRCPFRVERCELEFPGPEMLSASHQVHCFRQAEVAAGQHIVDKFDRFQHNAEHILSVPVRGTDAEA